MGNPFGVPGQKEPEEGSGEAEGDGGTSFTPLHLLERGTADPAHPVSSEQLSWQKL